MFSFKKNLFFFISCLIFCKFICCADQEFIYPVTYFENRDSSITILLLHQRSLYSVDLWLMNEKNKEAKKINLGFHLPSNLKLLPDLTGFSFFYKQKLCLKSFGKRNFKKIYFFEPIYDIGSIEWIDNLNCYFSAKKNNKFCIFQSNVKDQKIICIHKVENFENSSFECMYPQRIENDLFYIERQTHENFRTKKLRYKIVKTNYDINSTKSIETILDLKHSSIAFLKMNSRHDGYFIEHPNTIEKDEKTLLFTCHYFYKNNDQWQNEELFNFYLPSFYLFNVNYRLYESILPFLPKYSSKKIIFCSCHEEDDSKVDIYSYDLVKKYIEKKTNAQNGQIFFSPIIIGDKVFYGTNFLKSNSTMNQINFGSNCALVNLPFIDF